MKKLILLSACLLSVLALHAEQMQFVTTLSAPVGNFAHLDAADPTHVTSAPLLNFCNTRSGVGNIIIKGANAYLAQVNILNGATLGSTNTPEYRLRDNLTVENGGTVTAGRIMASNVTFKDTSFHKSSVTGTLYGSDIAAMGGKADNLEIASTAKITKGAQTAANLGQTMEWSNQYSKDYDSSGNAKSNGQTYTSFLLKSKGAAGCPTGKVEDSDGNCVCADRYNNTATYTKCSGTAYMGCTKEVLSSSSSGSTGVGTPFKPAIKLYNGTYSWNEETCKCDIDCDPSSVQTYYFKCVERLVGGMPPMTSDTYENYGDAYSACVSGKNTNAVYYKYLTGGDTPKDCPSYRDDKGNWLTCAVEDAYHIKYVCSTEPPKPCSGYGFCEQNCLTYVPGH